MPSKRKVQRYPVKLSDWICFLSDILGRYNNFIIYLGTITIVGIIGLYEIYRYIEIPISKHFVVAIFVLLCLVIIFIETKKRNKIKQLLDDIMGGTISSPTEIKNIWADNLKKHKI